MYRSSDVHNGFTTNCTLHLTTCITWQDFTPSEWTISNPPLHKRFQYVENLAFPPFSPSSGRGRGKVQDGKAVNVLQAPPAGVNLDGPVSHRFVIGIILQPCSFVDACPREKSINLLIYLLFGARPLSGILVLNLKSHCEYLKDFRSLQFAP